MKRMISAISSLAIAATAIGGTLAMSTSAAVDKTIIEFATEVGGKRVNTIEAKAGDKIPFSIYIPQSSGINTLSLKLSINGGKTLGEGLVEYPALDSDAGKKYYATTEGSKDKDKAGTTAKHPWAFGNYGITMTDGAYAAPYCFDSRLYKYTGKNAKVISKQAGNASLAGTCPITDDSMNINWMHSDMVSDHKNVDAYGAFVAAGSDYDAYKETTTWDKSASWAYDYAFVTGNLNLPSNLADGTYVLSVYEEDYYNSNSFFNVDPDDTSKVKPVPTSSSISGADGAVAHEIIPLTIKVGKPSDDPGETTDAPTQTTKAPDKTDAPGKTDAPAPAGTIELALVEDETGKSAYTAEPGEEMTVDLIVKGGDPGTAGMQLYFKWDKGLEITGMDDAMEAYQVSTKWNPDDGSYVFTTGKGKNETAADGSVMSYFYITAPTKEGTYTMTLDESRNNMIRPEGDIETVPSTPYKFTALTVTVGSKPSTTEEPKQTTEAPKQTTEAPDQTTEEPKQTTEVPTTEVPSTEAPGDVIWGDASCNKEVTIGDVVLLNKHLAGNGDLSAQGLKNVDVNHNGKPDTQDAVKIKAYLAELIAKADLAAAGNYTPKK